MVSHWTYKLKALLGKHLDLEIYLKKVFIVVKNADIKFTISITSVFPYNCTFFHSFSNILLFSVYVFCLFC